MKVASLAVTLLAAGAFSTARAEDKLPPGDQHADWLKRPTSNDLMAVWPHNASKTGSGGKATISCKISTRGLLTDCVVVSESPAGAGFGAAAVAISSQFQMKPEIRGGQPVESSVRIPINFPPFSLPSGPVETHPVLPVAMLLAAPSYAQVAAAYPAKAREKAVGGRVSMTCDVGHAGQVKGCVTLTEEPGWLGFGAAARSLAPDFLAPATLGDGTSTRDAVLQISVTFVTDMLKPDAVPVIGKPVWIAAPTGAQFSAAMPKGGVAVGTIRVTLDCAIIAGGHVSDCKVASENPPDKGFGASALAVAPYVQVSVWTPEGLPTVGARLRVPFRYEFGPPPPPPAPKP